MNNAPIADDAFDEAAEGPILPRRRVKDTADLDITPMIDIVFLLLIFFLVASIPDMQVEADLPAARHGRGVNPRTAVIVTVAAKEGSSEAAIYLGDGKVGGPLPVGASEQDAAICRAVRGEGGIRLPDDSAVQEDVICRAVLEGYNNQGKTTVLVKGEKKVLHRHVFRVATAVGSARAEGVDLNVAVYEVTQ